MRGNPLRSLPAGILLLALGGTAAFAQADSRDDGSPWGIASGAEWSGDFPRFNPMLKDAGVRWLRFFPEWASIQPRKGEWNWAGADALVGNSKENGIRVAGVFCYFAPWASADGGTRKCPVRDMQFWRDYVGETVKRYRDRVRYWEVWNEFNGSFAVNGTPAIYAEMVKEAALAAKKVDPGVRIGMSCANFDVGFFDAAIKAGAGGFFDFLAVHPYENLGAVMESGGEFGYLSMARTLRTMLAQNGQRADLPLQITETGYQAPIHPDPAKDERQAEAIVKAYVLSLAQGFQRVFWFEARGPAYGRGTDHGIIRKDWSPRPAHAALKTMSGLLGAEPRYAGWLKTGTSGFGFVFQGGPKPALVAWSPAESRNALKFDAPVSVWDLAGRETPLAAGQEFALSRVPVFVTGLPASQVALAASQAAKPFPWGTDYGTATEVRCRLGATNEDQGLRQIHPQTTAVVNDLAASWRRPNFAHGGEGRYVYFRVDPTFASFGNRDLEVTVAARRTAPDRESGMRLCYESLKGYREAAERWVIPEGEDWKEFTWKLDNANFAGGWGWNFRLDASSFKHEFFVREVRVRKPGPAAPRPK